jgi:hypothetical protein
MPVRPRLAQPRWLLLLNGGEKLSFPHFVNTILLGFYRRILLNRLGSDSRLRDQSQRPWMETVYLDRKKQ